MMKTRTQGCVEFLLHFFILFGFIFEMPLISILTTRRLAFLVATALVALNYKKAVAFCFSLPLKSLVVSLLGLLASMLLCTINWIGLEEIPGNQYYYPYYIVYIILYVIVFALYCPVLFDTVEAFAKTYVAIMLVQSVSVLVAVVHDEFRMFLYDSFYFGDSRFELTIKNGTRIMGIGLHSAVGSIILCVACALLIYLAINEKMKNSHFVISYLLVLAASFFIARTGFYISLLLLVVYFFLEKRNKIRWINLAVISGIGVAGVAVVLNMLDPKVANSLLTWAMELFNPDTRFNTFDILASMDIPAFSAEMVFGTNVTLGVTPGGAQMLSDSGYAKMYTALGIVGAVIFYGSFVMLYLPYIKNCKSGRNRFFLLLLVLIAFIIEYKEPFFQKYVYAWPVFALALFIEKEKHGGMEPSEASNRVIASIQTTVSRIVAPFKK